MSWKKKQKPLTPEEAVALAKKELAPLWLRSEPRLAAVKNPNGTAAVHPLDPEFLKKSWVLYFFDPSLLSGISNLALIAEWHRRYLTKEFEVLGILRTSYSFLKSQTAIEEFLPKTKMNFPVAVDLDGLLAEAFRIQQLPAFIILENGKMIQRFIGDQIFGTGEAALQSFLRVRDPGLPLPPPLEKEQSDGIRDLSSIEFSDSGLFPKPGFHAQNPADPASPWVAQFQEVSSPSFPSSGIEISGNWVRDGSRIITADPQATLRFRSAGKMVGLLAQSLGKEPFYTSEVSIELDGKPAFESACGSDLQRSDLGQTVLKVQGAKLYRALESLPDKNRNIQLRFMGAQTAPIALYSLRIAD